MLIKPLESDRIRTILKMKRKNSLGVSQIGRTGYRVVQRPVQMKMLTPEIESDTKVI